MLIYENSISSLVLLNRFVEAFMKKNQIPKSLLTQIIVFFILFLVLPITILGFFLHISIDKDLTKMEKERVLVSNQASHNLFEKFGESLLGVIITNSQWEDNRIAVKNKDINWINENVNVGINVIPNVSFISTIDLEGNVISQVGDVKEFTGKLSNKEILEQLKNKKEVSGLVETQKGLAMVAASKITNDEGNAEPTGILIFGRLLENKTLEEIKHTLQDDIALMTNNGTILSTSNKITKKKLSQNLAALSNHPTKKLFQIYELNSVEYAEMSTPLKDLSGKSIGVLYSNQKQKVSTTVKDGILKLSIVIGLIIILILIVLSVLINRFILNPIQHLVFISKEVSNGNLTNGVKGNVCNRQDELGKLGNSLNIMINNFRTLIKEVGQTIEQLASSAEQLSASSEQTTQATHQISTAVEQVASGSETQLQSTIESLNAVNEMVGGIQNVAKTVSVISIHSTKTEEEVEQGNHSIIKTIQQMENINLSFNESAIIVNQLAGSSNEIAKIASSISDIADQTNLLSLNAALEAARAGEQGRGFAVVAEEVRKLAVLTSDSAKQVSKIIEVIKSDSVNTVKSMDKVNNEMKEGLKQIKNVEKVFENILASAQDVANQTKELSVVSTQMSESTNKVTSSVEEVAEIARNSAESSKYVAYSSKEQLVAMQEITSASGYLTKMAQELKTLIGKFKV